MQTNESHMRDDVDDVTVSERFLTKMEEIRHRQWEKEFFNKLLNLDR